MLLRHCLLFGVLIAAVYTDLAQGKIYNWCTLPAIVAGLLVNYALGGLLDGGWAGANLGSSVLGLLVVGLVMGWPYLRGGIAAGDVKLMLAVGAIGGMHGYFVLYALLYSSLIGALMALVALVWRGKLREGVRGALRFTLSIRRLQPDGPESGTPGSGITIPYGFAISIGSVIAWYLTAFTA